MQGTTVYTHIYCHCFPVSVLHNVSKDGREPGDDLYTLARDEMKERWLN